MYIKRLKDTHPLFETHTHYCVLPDCPKRGVSVYRDKDKTRWVSSRAVEHLKKFHANSPLVKNLSCLVKSTSKEEKMKKRSMEGFLEVGISGRGHDTPKAKQGKLTHMSLSYRDKALNAQAKWFLYSTTYIPKQTFSDPLFKSMLCAAYNYGSGGPKVNMPIISRLQTLNFGKAELNVVVACLQLIINMKIEQSFGNQFLQVLHDGSTGSNGHKYQAIGCQFIDPKWKRNLVVCIGFARTR